MEPDRLENLLAVLAVGLTDAITGAVASESGLDPMAGTALLALLDFSPAGSIHRLAVGLGLTHSGAVRLVDRLSAAGLVRRRAGSDQRTIAIGLTAQGKSVAMRLRMARAARAEAALAGLSVRRRQELAKACELIVANLTRDRLDERAAGGRPTGGALCRMCDFAACGRPDGRCPTATVTGFSPDGP